jgi:hypothetical protein
VYYTFGNALGIYPGMVAFNSAGRPTLTERVAYDGGGNDSDPRAGAVGNRQAVIWQKTPDTGDRAFIEGTTFHPSRPANIVEKLGLNVGSLWGNVMLIMMGSLGGGAPLAVINILLLAPLMLLWFPISRFVPERWRLLTYLGVIAVALAYCFAISASAPWFVFVVPAFSPPYGWIAAAGGVFLAYWVGTRIFAHQDPVFRAFTMSVVAVYFVAVMYVVTVIQGELGQI